MEAVRGTRAQIVDTRKTLPGLRLAQKYAVRTGGGTNHRIGLYDAVLIKENHIAAAGGVRQVLRRRRRWRRRRPSSRSRSKRWPSWKRRWLPAPGWCCSTTWTCRRLREAVRINDGRAVLEISGGVTLESVRALAETGVDRISIGALTKDVKAIDFSMRFKEI